MHVLIFVLAIALFIALVLIHEWGHYYLARRNNVEVEEFGLGFPPRAFGKKLKSGMILSLNWLPLGGFVKLRGEHDSETKRGSFGAASLGAKIKILLAGVTMNALAGIVLLTILAVIGMPVLINKSLNGVDQFTVKSDTKVIDSKVLVIYVEPGSPAQKAGLKINDQLISFSSPACKEPAACGLLSDSAKLRSLTKTAGGQKFTIKYERAGQNHLASGTLRSAQEVQSSRGDKGYLGVAPENLQIRRSTWSAPIVALGFTKQLVVLTLQGLGHALEGLGATIAGLVTGNHAARENGQAAASQQVGGPVAIVKTLWNSGNLGFNFMLALIAIISLTLALINILPIPALDGGRLVMILISRGILKKPLSQEAEARFVGAGMLVILALIVLITVSDVNKYF